MPRRTQSWLDTMQRRALAMLAYIIRLCRGELLADVANGSRHALLENLSQAAFERLVAAAFRREGYLVVERGGRSLDGGIDLELYLGRDRYLVQCKEWRAAKVGIGTVRNLFAAMRVERAVGCFIVTAGSLTDDARAFETGRAIRLVPAESLYRMIVLEAAQGNVVEAVGRGDLHVSTGVQAREGVASARLVHRNDRVGLVVRDQHGQQVADKADTINLR